MNIQIVRYRLICRLCFAAAAVCPLLADAAPVLDVDTFRIEYGSHPNTLPIRTVFKIRNSGDEDLVIEQIKRSCTCVYESIADRTIPPQGRVDLVIGYEPERRSSYAGRHDLQAVVQTNDPVSQYTFTLSVDFVAPISVMPNTLLIHRTGSGGEMGSNAVTLRYAKGAASGTPRFSSVKPSGLDVTISNGIDTERFVEYRIAATLASEANLSTLSPSLEVETGDPGYPVLEIPLQVVGLSTAVCLPARLLLGVLERSDAPLLKEIQIRPTQADFAGEFTVRSDSPNVTIESLHPTSEGYWSMRVSVDRRTAVGGLSAHITVFDEQGTLYTVVPVLGTIR